MTLGEFVSLDPNKIRRDKELMQLFVDFYKAAFSLTPNCAGCVFKRGFEKLKRHSQKGEKKTVTLLKQETMENTFLLKKEFRLKILTYNENGQIKRMYGYRLTEEFARKLVEHGKEDLFVKLPDLVKQGPVKEPKKEVKQTTKKNYSEMDWKSEILPLYAEVRERTGEKADSRAKNDIIAFLEKHED